MEAFRNNRVFIMI